MHPGTTTALGGGKQAARILIVDDHEISRAALRALLRTEGIDVADVRTGDAAITATIAFHLASRRLVVPGGVSACFDRAGAQVGLGDEWVMAELGAELVPAVAGGEHDSRGIRQCLQPVGYAEAGRIGGCHVDDYHVGVKGDRGRDRRIAGPDVGDVDSLGAQQRPQRGTGYFVIVDDQDPRCLLPAAGSGGCA